MKRPTLDGNRSSVVTTPHAAGLAQLLGGQTYGSVAFTHDELEAVKRLYKFKPEKKEREDLQRLMQAGADRNALRHAESDGLRLLAWLAKYVPAGEDPLKHLVQLASDAGWDVNPEDVAWAESDDEFQDSAEDVQEA